MLPELRPVSLQGLSDIRCSCSLGAHPSASYDQRILLIRFEGTYRHGSSGKPDAAFIGAMGRAALFAFEPDGIITDFSALDYRWGNDMDRIVFGFGGDEPIASALVVGDGCRAALGTLLSRERPARDVCETDWIFDTLERAWRYVTTQIECQDL